MKINEEKKQKIAVEWWKGLRPEYRKCLYEGILNFPYDDFVVACEVVEIAEKIN